MNKFEEVPLHLMGDAIVQAYASAGIPVGISVTVVSMDAPGIKGGQVTSTSNIADNEERELLKWIVQQHENGAVSKEFFSGDDSNE